MKKNMANTAQVKKIPIQQKKVQKYVPNEDDNFVELPKLNEKQLMQVEEG